MQTALVGKAFGWVRGRSNDPLIGAMILQLQGIAGDIFTAAFQKTTWKQCHPLELAAASNHGILASTSSWADAHARLARLAALTTKKGGTAGKADNLRAAFFLRGAGYEPHEHV